MNALSYVLFKANMKLYIKSLYKKPHDDDKKIKSTNTLANEDKSGSEREKKARKIN